MGRTRLAAPSTLLSVIVQEKWQGCLRQMKMAATLFFFLDRRFTLRELEIRCNFIRCMRRIIYLENLSFYSSFEESLNTISLVIRTDFYFYFRLVLILFSILQYFSPFLFFLSGLAVKRIRYLYFANSVNLSRLPRSHFSISFLIGILSISTSSKSKIRLRLS